MKPKMHDIKDHPFFYQILSIKAKRAVEEFNELLKKDYVSNRELMDSVVVCALDEIINDESGSFHYKYEPGEILYRARTITDVNSIIEGNIRVVKENDQFQSSGFDEPNSIEPPLFKTKAARNNIAGMSYLYLAEDPYTACAEVRPYNHGLVSLSKFTINKPIKVIDFKDDHNVTAFKKFEEEYDLLIAPLFTGIMWYYTIPLLEPSIYKVTQFITDYIRKAGFAGVRYRSSMSAGTNLTLFNCHKSIISFESSELVLSNSLEYHLVCLNDGEEIKCEKDLNWKPENLEDARKEIYDKVSRVEQRSK